MARTRAPRDLFGRPLRKRPLDKNAEARRQAAIVEFVRWVAPSLLIWHVPNGGWRSKGEAGRMKWMGVLAGVWDLTIALPEARCAFWETKTDATDLSDEQMDFGQRMSAMGHKLAVVRSIDDARRELQAYGVALREAGSRES